MHSKEKNKLLNVSQKEKKQKDLGVVALLLEEFFSMVRKYKVWIVCCKGLGMLT